MTVAAIVQDPSNTGGAGTAVRWYLTWMERNRPGESDVRFLQEDSGTLEFFRYWRSPAGSAVPRLLPRLHVPEYIGLRRVMRRARRPATEAHSVGATALGGYAAAGAAPVLLWFATTIADERRAGLGQRALPRRALYRSTLPFLASIERKALRQAERLIVMSTHVADLLRASGIRGVEVLPVPVDTGVFRPSPLRERKGVLFVGRVTDPRKSFSSVLRLVDGSTCTRRAGVSIVSPGLCPSEVARRECCEWRGQLERLEHAYQGARLLFLPSLQEGFGIVAFEALACGTPVVARCCGGPDSLLRQSGGAFVCEDEVSMFRAAERLLVEDTLADEMGAAGREWVKRNLASDQFLADSSLFRL